MKMKRDIDTIDKTDRILMAVSGIAGTFASIMSPDNNIDLGAVCNSLYELQDAVDQVRYLIRKISPEPDIIQQGLSEGGSLS